MKTIQTTSDFPADPAQPRTHAQMHGEHQQWIMENGLHRDEIRVWQASLKKLMDQMKGIEQAIHDHNEALRIHAAAIRAYELDLRAHEHALARYEQGENAEELIELAQGHQREAEKQAQQRDAHERMKRHHHGLIADWQRFITALGSAE